MGVLLPAIALFSALLTNSAEAATIQDIAAQAKTAYTSGQALEAVVSEAFGAAAKSDILAYDLAPAVSETLVQATIDAKKDPIAVSGKLGCAMLGYLKESGADDATILRTVPPMVAGVRAACDRNGVDSSIVQNQIETQLKTCGGELVAQLLQMVAQAYTEPHAETYTQAAPAPTPPAAPAASSGTSVAGAFTPTASKGK
jgi:hypothetical protein